MTRTFVYMPKFDKEWAKLGLNDDDLRQLETYLLENPNAGDIMEGTGGIRKLRWVLPNQGKSGGIRVLFIDFISYEKICIFDLFPKDEKHNLTKAEKNKIKDIVKSIREEFKNE